ncbi:ferritin family protein [Clostridioides difficile]
MYSVNLPYPEVKVKEKNPKYLDLILLNYASSISEFDAIAQYTYHQIALTYENKEIAETIRGISIVEMHHLELLGQIIIKLGGEPGFWINNKKKNYWSAKLVNYDLSSIENILTIDIQDEKAAIKQYKETISKIDDEYINAVIKRIILDEEFHIQLLVGLYTKYVK